MSLSLKHIPCPAGSKCTAFQCIFGHESDETPSPAVQQAEDVRDKLQESTKAPSPDLDRPRKRFKIDGARDCASSTRSTPSSTESSTASKTEVQAAEDFKPKSALRPISPPPVKRNLPTNGRAKDAVTAASAPRGSQLFATPASKSNTPEKQKKPETLNPRLLKSSPASHEIRLKLLKMVHTEFKRLNTELSKDANDTEQKLVLSDQELIIRALDEEQKCAVEKPAVYANVMKNKIMQHKRMSVAQWKETRTKEAQALRKRRLGDSADPTDGEPKEIKTGLTPAQEVRLLRRILTPITDLQNHRYVPTVPTEDSIRAAREGLEAAKGWEKCDRCQQRFQVFPGRREEDGALTSGGSCNFHWGKAYVPDKLPGDKTRVPKRYHCCGQEVGDSVGCFTHEHHVFKASEPRRLAATLNFAETPANDLAPTDRAVCFDCEMCYTVNGLELVRLTATSWPDGEDILDVLVQPLGEILDLNSRFSGVWPDDLASAEAWTVDDGTKPVKTGCDGAGENGEAQSNKKLKIVSSPEVARDLLFSLISPSTPLIGHGLENDLNAVRIVHPTIVDTVLLYPHKMGLPYRHGLKALMSLHLNRKIQQETGSKMTGHDSAEDARAAGDLVRLRIMNEWNDMKREGWKIVEGEMTPPAGQGALTEAFIESRS